MITPSQCPVPSPCIGTCRMNERSGLCEGCLRNLDEIAAWSQASNPHKLAIMAQIVKRREAASADCNAD